MALKAVQQIDGLVSTICRTTQQVGPRRGREDVFQNEKAERFVACTATILDAHRHSTFTGLQGHTTATSSSSAPKAILACVIAGPVCTGSHEVLHLAGYMSRCSCIVSRQQRLQACKPCSIAMYRTSHCGICRVAGRRCKELKTAKLAALPLSRRGSRSQSLGKRRTLFGRIGSGGVWRRARKWRTWNPA